MNKFFSLLRVQILRALKQYPAILCCTLVLVLAVVLFGAVMLSSYAQEDKDTAVNVGLVGDFSDSYLQVGVAALENMEITNVSVSFTQMSETDAAAKLKSGQLMGYLKIPADFAQLLLAGKEAHLQYVTVRNPAQLGSVMVQEIGVTVSEMLMAAQNGVYAAGDYARQARLSAAERQELNNRINMEYIELALSRESLYELHELGYSNELPFALYYVCGFIVLLMMLWGLVCIRLLVKTDLTLSRVLRLRGCSSVAQVLAEYLSFLLILVLNLLLVFAVIGTVVQLTGFSVAFLRYYETVWQFLWLGVSLIPAAALIATLQYCLYTVTTQIIGAAVIQIVSLIALAFAGGLLLPANTLPPLLRTVAPYLPTGMGLEYVGGVLTDTTRVGALPILGYCVFFLGIAALAREIAIREVQQ